MSRVFAYCRVSTTDQTTENQVLEISAAGFAINGRRIVEETISGSVPAEQRPGFQRLMDRLESGDVLVVTKVTIPRQSRGHSGCEPLKAAVRGR